MATKLAGSESGGGVERKSLDSVVIRFAGDSGDGMQLTGTQFTQSTALAGNDLATFPDFPAEIRAPIGTTYGVSAFQINFASYDIMTPGDAPDVLVAMNPAALAVNIDHLKPGGLVINTARGPIVNLDDLFEALKAGTPAGAALDVLPVEPADTSHPLVKAYMNREEWLDGRLMITPHAAFYSPPGLHDLRSKAVATVAQRLRDGSTRNCQNLDYLVD